MASTPIVLGSSIYLEFYKLSVDSSTVISCGQMLMTPEITHATAATAGLSIAAPITGFRRTLHSVAPRRQWKQFAAGSYVASARASSGNNWDDITSTVMYSNISAIQRYINAGWSLREPMVVEFTSDDVEAVRQGKLPYRVMGRVNKVRAAMGLPKDLVGCPAVA